jgi:protein-L-isoaspartate O-methyltransferase
MASEARAGALRAPDVINALWAQAKGRQLARNLAHHGQSALVLSGPELQSRLFGSPSRHPSPVLDLSIRPEQAHRICHLLVAFGYGPDPLNDPLWRLGGARLYSKEGHTVRIRWRSWVNPLPGQLFRRLRDALWRGATKGVSGYFEAQIEPLFVYLSIEATRGAGDPAALEIARAAADRVRDERVVRQLAAECRVGSIVERVRSGESCPPSMALDGIPEVVDNTMVALSRAHFLPIPLRQAVMEHLSFKRHGLRVLNPRKRSLVLDGRAMTWWEGVCGPGTWTGELVDLWIDSVEGVPDPILVEVGTGTGALAVAAAIRRPDADIHATDISFRATANARENVVLNSAAVHIHRSDLMRGLPPRLRGRVDAVLAHLPSMWLGGYSDSDGEAVWAPRETYEGGGAHGLDLVRRLMSEARPWLSEEGRLVLSMKEWQWQLLTREATEAGYRVVETRTPSATGLLVMLSPEPVTSGA